MTMCNSMSAWILLVHVPQLQCSALHASPATPSAMLCCARYCGVMTLTLALIACTLACSGHHTSLTHLPPPVLQVTFRLPPHCKRIDCILILDDKSEVSALNSTMPIGDAAVGKMLRLPLPGVSKQQIHIFLSTVYSLRADRFVGGLSFALLRDLADISHKYASHEVLQMADAALVTLSRQFGKPPASMPVPAFGLVNASQSKVVSSSFMTPANALSLYAWAGRIDLKAFREEAAAFLVSRAHDLDFNGRDTDQTLLQCSRCPSCMPGAHEVQGCWQALPALSQESEAFRDQHWGIQNHK